MQIVSFAHHLQNPFVFLFVAPVAVSATILRPAVTAMLSSARRMEIHRYGSTRTRWLPSVR